MNKKRIIKFLKIIGIEFGVMLLITAAAAFALYVQYWGKKYIGEYSSILFSGDSYEYNLFAYLGGIVLYIGCLLLFYFKMLRSHIKKLTEYGIGYKIIACLLCIIVSFAMLAALAIVNFITLGWNTIDPNILNLLTVFGWPIMTALLIEAMMIFDWHRKQH